MSKSRRVGRGAAWLAAGLWIAVLSPATASADYWSADDIFQYARLYYPPASEPRAAALELSSLPPQPFGSVNSALLQGGLQSKWQAVKVKLRRESRILQRCRSNPESCPAAAQEFLAIVDTARTREGLTRIAEINRAINLSIRPRDDETLYGVREHWATPLTTFARRAGDCEDYAIAKYVALQQIGMSTDDLRLVVVHDPATGDGHAMAAARFEGRWLVLDNRRTGLAEDSELADARPLFMIDRDGARRVVAFNRDPQRTPRPGVTPGVTPAEPVALSASGWPPVAAAL
jgi:predicted transglutaminase-like cysteine proteinase